MTINPISAITGATSDRILDDPLVDRFCLAVMEEAAAIGARIGCPITQSGEERNGHAPARRLPDVSTRCWAWRGCTRAGRAVSVTRGRRVMRLMARDAGCHWLFLTRED